MQAAAQRFVVSASAPNQAKAVVGGTATVAGKTISQAQLQIIRQHTLKQQLRLQTGGITAQAVKTTTIAGHTAVQVQFTQAQPRTTQVICLFNNFEISALLCAVVVCEARASYCDK